VRSERGKRRLGDPERMIVLGRIQDAVLRAYFGAIQGAERLDLIRFVVDATRVLLDERGGAAGWQPVIESAGPLHRRSDARQAATALLRNLRTVRHWVEQASGVRFFDDEYDAAQLLLRVWEPLGEAGYQRALAIARELESIDSVVGDSVSGG
jgi:hypothetical protein